MFQYVYCCIFCDYFTFKDEISWCGISSEPVLVLQVVKITRAGYGDEIDRERFSQYSIMVPMGDASSFVCPQQDGSQALDIFTVCLHHSLPGVFIGKDWIWLKGSLWQESICASNTGENTVWFC